MKRKRTRSIASYRAASLKGARSKRSMRMYQQAAREFAEWLSPETVIGKQGDKIFVLRKPRTIDLIPKVKWP